LTDGGGIGAIEVRISAAKGERKARKSTFSGGREWRKRRSILPPGPTQVDQHVDIRKARVKIHEAISILKRLSTWNPAPGISDHSTRESAVSMAVEKLPVPPV